MSMSSFLAMRVAKSQKIIHLFSTSVKPVNIAKIVSVNKTTIYRILE